jgi:cytochrome c oxidase subunit IV
VADTHDVQAHSQHKSHKKEYIIVFVALGILTILEIWIAEVNMSALRKGSGLTFLAVAKAFLVAYYYMHLKDETRWTKFIAAVPIAAAVYATVLCLEAVYKPV